MRIDVIVTYCKTQPTGLHTFSSLQKADCFRSAEQPEIFAAISRAFEATNLCIVYVVKASANVIDALDNPALPSAIVGIMLNRWATPASDISVRLIGVVGCVDSMRQLASRIESAVNNVEQLKGSTATVILE
jgi:hypothetical protein